MSNYSTDCISGVPSQANFTTITACQSVANTTFCWPPNGARICVPGPQIPFYWPPSYYPAKSRVEISFGLDSNIFPAWDNDGSMNESVTSNEYLYRSIDIRGEPNAKSVDMLMYTRDLGAAKVENHRGPTIVLVKTREFGSPYPSSTPRSSSSGNDDDKDPLTGLTDGGVAGIIVAIMVAIIAIVVACCCCGCCACCGFEKRGRRRARPVVDAEEQARVIVHGTELMEQRKPGAVPVLTTPIGNERLGEGSSSRNEIGRVEEASDLMDPPPKYTP